MKTTFKNAKLVSVDNGTIVLNEEDSTRIFFKDASLVSIVDGNITINHPDYNYNFKDGDIVVFYNFTTAGKTIQRYKHQIHDLVYFHGFIGDSLNCSKLENSYLYPASPAEIEEFKIVEKQNNVYWDQSTKTYIKYPKLTEGLIVESENGTRFLTMKDENGNLIGISQREWSSNIQRAFTLDNDSRIIKVYKAKIQGIFSSILNNRLLELIWER